MSEDILSLFLGPFFILCFFAAALFLTVGAKFCFYTLKKLLYSAPVKKREVKPRKKAPVKSLEINAEDVDRIYFRKAR